MDKYRNIGGLSMTERHYSEKFVSLSKDAQIERVANSLSPKDRVYAEKLLTRIPNGGNISSGVDKESGEGNSSEATGGKPQGNTAKPKATAVKD